jgi:hypothetical protein
LIVKLLKSMNSVFFCQEINSSKSLPDSKD